MNGYVSKKFTNLSLHMAGITQNKQKCLIFIVVPQGRKNVIRLDQKEEYSTPKKIKIKKIRQQIFC